MDQSLTFRSHLKKSAAKLGTRDNLLSKLAGFSWGAQASTLRTSALAICYSAAEYCAPVWSRSSHTMTNLIDSQLNETMRIITGTLRPTPLSWLPVPSHIAPPRLRRQEATTKLLTKIELNDSLPLHKEHHVSSCISTAINTSNMAGGVVEKIFDSFPVARWMAICRHCKWFTCWWSIYSSTRVWLTSSPVVHTESFLRVFNSHLFL